LNLMPRVNRHKLHFGPYRTPRFKYGAKVECQARGDVMIVRLTAGRIPWPVGKTHRATSMVVYADLARAVRREAACAVMHWWGVGASTVWIWRRALGVPHSNEGDRKLRIAYNKSPSGRAAIEAMHGKARDPVRRAKIAAAKRGKPRPPHVMAALRKANIGRKLSAEHRRKIGAAHKRRGTMPPAASGPTWQPWEDELVRTLPPAEVVQRTGRTLQAVFVRRNRLKVPDGRSRR
jgi:NUMOD3 motif